MKVYAPFIPAISPIILTNVELLNYYWQTFVLKEIKIRYLMYRIKTRIRETCPITQLCFSSYSMLWNFALF